MKVASLVGGFRGEHKAERALRLTGLLGLLVSISRTITLGVCMLGGSDANLASQLAVSVI